MQDPLQKDLVDVSLMIDGHAELLDGNLYKDVALPGSDIKYALENYLHRAPQFMPFKDQEENFYLINKNNIIYLKLHEDSLSKKSNPSVPSKSIQLDLTDDKTLTGNTCNPLSEGKKRMSDYVNRESFFLLIDIDGTKVYVNKLYMLKISETGKTD